MERRRGERAAAPTPKHHRQPHRAERRARLRLTRPPPRAAALLGHALERRQFDIEAERAHFLDQHVEALRNARFERVVAAHDRLVHLGAAGDVVRLDGQHLLERVRRAISLERPHLHFAESLSAELRLAAQRLLGDEAVGADRSGMDLVVDEVVELQHVDVAHRDLAIEGVAGAPVVERHLARRVEVGLLEHLDDVLLARAVEHRRCDRHAPAQVLAELGEAVVVQGLDRLVVAVDLLELAAQRLRVVRAQIGVDRLADLPAKTGAGPAEMGLEDLPDVHAARHAERIEHDIDRRAVVQERHVLLRHDARHDALVAMAPRHLVAGLDLALHRDENLDHLHHAGRQFVAALQLLDLVEEAALERLLRFVVLLAHRLDLRHRWSDSSAKLHHCERGCSSSSALVST